MTVAKLKTDIGRSMGQAKVMDCLSYKFSKYPYIQILIGTAIEAAISQDDGAI